jgi:DNA-binding protein Fis
VTLAVPSIPALIALVLKLLLIAYVLRFPLRNRTASLFLGLLVVFSLQNLIEFLGLNDFAHADYSRADVYGRLYFAMVIPFLAILLHLSLRLSYDSPTVDRLDRYAYALYVPTILLEALLFGNQLIVGFRPFEYSILREPGPLYFLFETYATLYMLIAISSLMYGARADRASFPRTRNRLWLYAMLPIALLVVYLIVANHFGWTRLTSTFYLPIAITLFLGVTTYATYQYRLFDIEFFIPWSRVRKRKTAFYKRIQATISEVVDLKSVQEILDLIAHAIHCQVALIGGPRPVLALANGQQADAKNDLSVLRFPREALRDVDHIVVANEIENSLPELHALMKQYKIGAIVPFNAHSSTAGHWMLLGEHFSDEVYTPLDFKVVETLFDRIGERFLDNMLLLRSQLSEANDELHDYQRRLTVAWSELESLRKTLARTEEDNKALREEKANLMRQRFHVIDSGLPHAIESGTQTLAEYMAEAEREMVRAALRDCGGNRIEAARLLGIRPRTLHYLIQRHDLEPEVGT